MAMNVEAEIRDLKRRVSELEGSFGFLTNQVKAVRKDLLTFEEKTEQRFDKVEGKLDRLESKIRSLSEMAINRQEPEFISGQVDQVANSMLETERTMNELKFATGLDTLDEEPADLLRGKLVREK